MAAVKHLVTIKGVKDGLIFQMNDDCAFSDLIKELKHKLEKTHDKFLNGPITHVWVKLGKRLISQDDRDEILKIIGGHGNLIVKSIESDAEMEAKKRPNVKIVQGVIRSGQTVAHKGHILYIGDVNPGGTICATGNIWVLGALRGMAHAGSEGDDQAVIAASYLSPTQLRIADIISRPPDEWDTQEMIMEFAYLQDGKMEINKISNLHKIRPGTIEFKGV